MNRPFAHHRHVAFVCALVVLSPALAAQPFSSLPREKAAVVAGTDVIAGLRALRSAPGADALEEFVTLLGSLEGPMQSSVMVRSTFRLVLDKALAEDALTPMALRRAYTRSSDTLRGVAIGVLTRDPTAKNLKLLAELLHLEDADVTRVLGALAILRADATIHLDAHARWRVRARLTARDPRVRQAAAGALANLHDVRSASNLIDLLEDPTPYVVSAARTALERLSGRRLGPSPDAWDTWLRTETQWIERDAAKALADLESAQDYRVLAGLSAVAEHRLFRDDLIDAVTLACHSENPIVRQAACQTAGALGSPLAIPSLKVAAFDDHAAVSTVARAVLMRLTGEKF